MDLANILNRIRSSIHLWGGQTKASKELVQESLIRLDFSVSSLKKSADELWRDADLTKLISFNHSYQDLCSEIECTKALLPEKSRQILEDFCVTMVLLQEGKAQIIFYPELEVGDIDLKIIEVKRCIENSQHIKAAVDDFCEKFREEYLKIKVY